MQNSIELLEQFEGLPDDAKKVIRQFKYDAALKAIHEKYRLHIDQAAALEKEVAKVIFGNSKSHELIPSIERELRIPPEKAKEIAFDINQTMLKPLQEAMKNLQLGDGSSI